MPTPKLSNEILTAAILGFEGQKRRIDTQIAELRAMLDGSPAKPVTPEAPSRKRRKMSAAARKRIGDAQRKRWAASTGEPELPSETITAKPKRKMSAAGRKAISDATKKRWAAKKAEAAKAKPATTKKAAVKMAVTKKSATKKTATTSAQTATQAVAQ